MTNITPQEAIEKLNAAMRFIECMLVNQAVLNQVILTNRRKVEDYDVLLGEFNNLYHQVQYKDGYKFENDFLWHLMETMMTEEQRKAIDRAIEELDNIALTFETAKRDQSGLVTFHQEQLFIKSRELREKAERLKQLFWLEDKP